FGRPPAPWESTVLLPQPKPATEGVGIVAGARVRRQRIKFFDVASADHDVVGLERGKEACHNICHVTTPLLLSVAVQSGVTYIVLISALLVGQVTELHRLHDAVDDHGRSKPGSEAEKEHLAAPVAPQSLHCGVVNDLHGMAECRCE